MHYSSTIPANGALIKKGSSKVLLTDDDRNENGMVSQVVIETTLLSLVIAFANLI